MSSTMPAVPPAAHRVIPEIGPAVSAKADLRFPDVDGNRQLIGRALRQAAGAMDWNLDQLAQALTVDKAKPRDPRQIARWIDGHERVQLDVVMLHNELFGEFLFRLAKLHGIFEAARTLTQRSA